MAGNSVYDMTRMRVLTLAPGRADAWHQAHISALVERSWADFLPSLHAGPLPLKAIVQRWHDHANLALVVNDASVYGVMAAFVTKQDIILELACVERQVRSQGWAQAMHEALAAQLDDTGRPFVTSTWSTNHAWLKVLERNGYLVESREVADRGPGVDTVNLIRPPRSV